MYRHFHHERAGFLRLLAAVGLSGCASLIIGTLVAPWFVPNHNWVADTISDLAAGEAEIYMDVALYGFAAGLLAVSLGAAHAHLGETGWSIGTMTFTFLAAVVVVLAARNEYGDNDSEGIVIHSYLVYGLGVLFLVAPLTMAAGLRNGHARARRIMIGLAVLWALAAPVFFFMPTGYDGLYERMLGLVACAIVVTFCFVFAKRARDIR